MKGTKRLEPKLDGVRVLMMVIPYASHLYRPNRVADIVCYSRNGKVFENFEHIEKQVEVNINEIIAAAGKVNGLSTGLLKKGFMLDGEVVGNSFQELMRQARRKENVSADDSVFHVFDILPIDDFKRGHWNAQLSKRIDALYSRLDLSPTASPQEGAGKLLKQILKTKLLKKPRMGKEVGYVLNVSENGQGKFYIMDDAGVDAIEASKILDGVYVSSSELGMNFNKLFK